MAYSDAFWTIAVGLIISIAAIPLLREPQKAAGPIEVKRYSFRSDVRSRP